MAWYVIVFLVSFFVFLLCLVFSLAKISGYWSRVEEQEELERMRHKN